MILFIYCYYGEAATNNYLNFADTVYEIDWFKLPSNLKGFVILMIQNAQKPIYYHGFNIVYLNLTTFSAARTFTLTFFFRN